MELGLPKSASSSTTGTVYVTSQCCGGSVVISSSGIPGSPITISPGNEGGPYTVASGTSVTLSTTSLITGWGFSYWGGFVNDNNCPISNGYSACSFSNPYTFTVTSGTTSVTGSFWGINGLGPNAGTSYPGGSLSTTASITWGYCTSATISVPNPPSWLTANVIGSTVYFYIQNSAPQGSFQITVQATCNSPSQVAGETVSRLYQLTVGNLPLQATAQASTLSGPAPLYVQFYGFVSGGVSPYYWNWQFQDGFQGTTQNPSHTFNSPGDYQVTLTVTDSSQPTAQQSSSHLTISVGVPPEASVTFATTGMGSDASGSVLTVDGSTYSMSQLPTTLSWVVGSSHSYAWSSPVPGASGSSYIWQSTSGCSQGSQSGNVIVPTSGCTVTATYQSSQPTASVTFATTGMGSDASGSVLTVDGSTYSMSQLPTTLSWVVGSSHSYAWSSPVPGASGSSYIWQSTSGCSQGSQSGNVIVPTSGCTVTATYQSSPSPPASTTISLSNFQVNDVVNLNDPFPTWGDAQNYAISIANLGWIPDTAARDFGTVSFSIDVSNSGSVTAQDVMVDVTFVYTLTYSVCLQLNICTFQQTYSISDTQPTYVGTVLPGQPRTINGQFTINYASVYAMVVYEVYWLSWVKIIGLPGSGADATLELATATGSNTNTTPEIQASTSVSGLNFNELGITVVQALISSQVGYIGSKLNSVLSPYMISLGYNQDYLTAAGEILEGTTVDYKVVTYYAEHAIWMTLGTLFHGSTLELRAISPTGQVFQASSSSGAVQLFIQNPALGAWDVQVIGLDVDPGGENYTTNAAILGINSVVLSPSSGAVGDYVKISGSGLLASHWVKVSFDLSLVATCATDSGGNINPGCVFKIPRSSSGPHTITISDGITDLTKQFILSPQISLSSSSGPAGTIISVKGTGFASSQPVTLTFFGSSGPVPLTGKCQTNARGVFPSSGSCRFTVPSSLAGAQTATFSDGNNSIATTFTVDSLVLTCSHSSILVGAYSICRATIKGISPTGVVSWTSSGNGTFSRTLCTLVYGTCSVRFWSTSADPQVAINASYGGDSMNAPTSAVFDLKVTWKPTMLRFSCAHAVAVAESIACTVKVLGYLPSGNVWWLQSGTGSVSFLPSTCTLSNGVCSVVLTGVTPGKVVILASYPGNLNNLGGSRKATLTVTMAK